MRHFRTHLKNRFKEYVNSLPYFRNFSNPSCNLTSYTYNTMLIIYEFKHTEWNVRIPKQIGKLNGLQTLGRHLFEYIHKFKYLQF